MDAHFKVDMVLNVGDENEDETLFNEIICYDSGDSSQENEQSDISELRIGENAFHNSLQNLNDMHLNIDTNRKSRSNAESMRKYRAKQRNDPARYQKYLERERMRNFKRKYEMKIQEAQQRARAMGVPFIVMPPPNIQRGRRTKFGDDYDSNCSLVIPANFENFTEDEWDYFDLSDMPKLPLEVELREMDEIYAERLPNIPNGNRKKLSQPRSVLQTLPLKELDDREPAPTNYSVKLDHDYVKEKVETYSTDRIGKIKKRSEKNKNENAKYEWKKQQERYRRFVAKEKRRRKKTEKKPLRKPPYDLYDNNCIEHEDLDDLFEELAKVANKELPKKKQSHRNHTLGKQEPAQDNGRFSLTVSMPVQLITSKSRNVEETKSPRDSFSSGRSNEPRGKIWINDSPERCSNDKSDTFICNEDSIEIKQEPIHSDDEFC